MVLKKYKKLECLSCHFQCELYPQATIKMMNCIGPKYCMWPDRNFYLKHGMQLLLMNSSYGLLDIDLIFVDFSRYNIRLFTNKEWIHYLTRTDLRLVLIADRFTHPLALYWKKQCQQIAAVISVDDTKKEIQRKIQLHFFGGKVGENTQPKLSDIEVQILELMIAEKSVKRIADELSLSEKRIYAIKLSLQNKMGGRGRLNIMLSG